MEENNDTYNAETEAVDEAETDETRRSFMKKGALASGGLALGLAGAGNAAAQNNPRVLVYAYEYHPGVQFQVTAPLQQSTTVRALSRPGGGTVPEISQPDDYNGYVIRYRLGQQGGQQRAGITTFLFTRQNLQQGRTYRLSGQAQVFSSALNLLDTTANRV